MKMLQQELDSVLTGMQGKKILVIGDMVADIYLDGRISRISREAPVLVLEKAGEKIVAGGRATVSQQIVRIDAESKEPMGLTFEEKLHQYIESILPEIEGVVLSDYGSGTITEGLQQLLISYCQEHDLPSIVDSRYDIRRFHGIGYVKQNDAELAAAVGRKLHSTEEICEAGEELRRELDADGVLVTRGELGMTLVERDGSIHNIPVSDKSEVFDVSGAGDTCVAAVILALASGAKSADAARLSNIASGIAVRKLGTSTVSADELRRTMHQLESSK